MHLHSLVGTIFMARGNAALRKFSGGDGESHGFMFCYKTQAGLVLCMVDYWRGIKVIIYFEANL